MKDKPNIYFIGAGGIGMAALERYFLAMGKNVAGYDRTPSTLIHALQQEGVRITFGGYPDEIPPEMTDPETTTVVYTPAVPRELPIFKWFLENGFQPVKRAALLGDVTKMTDSICVAGTHGKTTTSSIIAHILNNSPSGCNAFLGGILRNYNTNFILNPASSYSVIEADEFDRSFHFLTPFIAVITSADPDHLDIYGTEKEYLESFNHFTSLIRTGGALILHTDLKVQPHLKEHVRLFTYSKNNGDYHGENIRYHNGDIIFDFIGPGIRIPDISLGVPVEINVENTIAALAAIHAAGILEPLIAKQAIATFLGPKRRFEYHLKQTHEGGKIIIDDYAHHPEELRASISSVKKIFPDKHLTVAFQPHLYSRTQDFADAFAQVLSLADSLILLDIYPARELPIPGVTSEIIYRNVNLKDKTLISKHNLIETLKLRNFEILLTVGAGDINDYIPGIIQNCVAHQ